MKNVVAISVERTALDISDGVITIHSASHNNPCVRAGTLFIKRTAGNGSSAVNQNSSRYSPSRSCFPRERTAGDSQLGAFLALDHVQTAGVGTAGDGQGAPVVDHGGAGVARRGGDIRQRQVSAAVLRDLDVVVVVAAHNITVLHGNGAAGHGDRGLAGVGVGQGLAAQIEGDALADDHILSGVSQQGHGLAVLSRRNGLL